MKEKYVWLVEVLQQKDELKYVSWGRGALCVMTSGAVEMPEWSAGNLDLLMHVSNLGFHDAFYILHMQLLLHLVVPSLEKDKDQYIWTMSTVLERKAHF